uniref:Uncharacterized protein n=1 Tax=Lotharella globosa TaxID=91324 RepID=A0A7S3Z3U0_9EUKA
MHAAIILNLRTQTISMRARACAQRGFHARSHVGSMRSIAFLRARAIGRKSQCVPSISLFGSIGSDAIDLHSSSSWSTCLILAMHCFNPSSVSSFVFTKFILASFSFLR